MLYDDTWIFTPVCSEIRYPAVTRGSNPNKRKTWAMSVASKLLNNSIASSKITSIDRLGLASLVGRRDVVETCLKKIHESKLSSQKYRNAISMSQKNSHHEITKMLLGKLQEHMQSK
jgi:hypothetical protein